MNNQELYKQAMFGKIKNIYNTLLGQGFSKGQSLLETGANITTEGLMNAGIGYGIGKVTGNENSGKAALISGLTSPFTRWSPIIGNALSR